jgi:hypothetical protein
MARRAREHAAALAFAAGAVWLMTYLGLYGFGWNDYSTEALPAYDALTGGHLWSFLALAPGYGGSLELRAPFALLPALWSGREVAVYQAVSIPCLAAAALLAVWLTGEMRARGQGVLTRATVLGLCAANPITLYALQVGHAEELLGGVLCVAAVLVAARGHAVWAGLLLGLAIVNKEWALLAVGPVLVALPAQRWRALSIATVVAGCFYAPLLLAGWIAHSGGGGPAPLASSGAGSIFQPWQLWWFLGAHGHLVTDTFGFVKVGYRVPPGWVQTLSHPLIVLVGVPATLLAARRRGADAMLLLAFLLALRCALDTWDTVYYPLPFLLALVAWEAVQRRRPPLFTLAASVVVWLVFIVAPEHLSADAQAALFAAVAVPVLAALAAALYAPGTIRGDSGPDRAEPADRAGLRSAGARAAAMPST